MDPSSLNGLDHSASLTGPCGADHTMDPSPPTHLTPPTVSADLNGADQSMHHNTSSHLPGTSSYINLALEDVNGGLKTCVGNHMKKVLECDDDLIAFDELRFTIKEARKRRSNIQRNIIAKYNKLAAMLGTRVLRKQSQFDRGN